MRDSALQDGPGAVAEDVETHIWYLMHPRVMQSHAPPVP